MIRIKFTTVSHITSEKSFDETEKYAKDTCIEWNLDSHHGEETTYELQILSPNGKDWLTLS